MANIEARKTTVGAAVVDAFSEFQSLRDEVAESAENLESANMPTAERFREAADALDSFADNEPEIPAVVDGFEVTYHPGKRYRGRQSRPSRRDEAVNMLQGAIDSAQQWLDNEANDEHAENGDVEQFISELEDVIGDADGVDFPGMFGK